VVTTQFPTASLSETSVAQFLFVYGTLLRRSPHPMARALAQQARFVGEAAVAGRLFDLGRFPGMTEPSGAEDRVFGDLYELADGSTTLQDLDVYEEVESPLPAFFDRQSAGAILADGTRVQAWVYWYRGKVAEARRIASGRYLCGPDPATA
jgi:gamma-glutamylcyclotransferase (GGCT)/AIG2-like uncharacterized protein YtfP